jgi:GAF domain-containing protein
MPNEALLTRTLVTLAGGLVDDFDLVDLLTLLADRCVEALDVASAGVMIAASRGELQVIASSSDTMRTLELFELQSSQGPCVDCYRTGQPVTIADLTDAIRRWPRFAQRAIDEQFRSVHALPMRLRGQTIGALNLFCTDPEPLGEPDLVAAQALADVATIAIIHHRSAVDAHILNQQLAEALNSRIIIEQAKGKISEAAHLDMDQAFQRLRRHARSHHLRLTDLARDIATGTVTIRSLDPFP